MCVTDPAPTSKNANGVISPIFRVAPFVAPPREDPAYVKISTEGGSPCNDDQNDGLSIGNTTIVHESGIFVSGQSSSKRGDETRNVFWGNAKEVSANGPDSGPISTLMIKNIPCRCNKDEVLKAIHESGFAEKYDFFHLPMRRSQNQNLGYAFISLCNPTIIPSFCAYFEGYVFKHRMSTKVVTVVPAHIQGYSGNLEYFTKTSIMESDHGPIFARVQNDCENGAGVHRDIDHSPDIRACKKFAIDQLRNGPDLHGNDAQETLSFY
eukprot:TRINITY_DN70073_c0_g1_i1.p1 TRINITY_DN70073_c0_g1~~TRINITY_DN70073_c0_g1_i1.p1  ORF type:complete len:266 (+),score=20.79 TRINITY_DN70073_c0_g1_i1:89-886(+)